MLILKYRTKIYGKFLVNRSNHTYGFLEITDFRILGILEIPLNVLLNELCRSKKFYITKNKYPTDKFICIRLTQPNHTNYQERC